MIKTYTPDSRLTEEEKEICILLRSLKMTSMAEEFEHQVLVPNSCIGRSSTERLLDLVRAETDARHTRKVNRLMNRSMIRYPEATFDNSIYDPARALDTALIEELQKCRWISEGKNLLITGPSSSGKTWLCSALCVAAMNQLMSVYYIKANRLMLMIEQNRDDTEKTIEFHDRFCSYDLLVIDDFGLMEMDIARCLGLFELIDEREGRKSLMIISQRSVKNWYSAFESSTYADACLSRITDPHRCYRLEMNGQDMRKWQPPAPQKKDSAAAEEEKK